LRTSPLANRPTHHVNQDGQCAVFGIEQQATRRQLMHGTDEVRVFRPVACWTWVVTASASSRCDMGRDGSLGDGFRKRAWRSR
jgi:hypothetical protein